MHESEILQLLAHFSMAELVLCNSLSKYLINIYLVHILRTIWDYK